MTTTMTRGRHRGETAVVEVADDARDDPATLEGRPADLRSTTEAMTTITPRAQGGGASSQSGRSSGANARRGSRGVTRDGNDGPCDSLSNPRSRRKDDDGGGGGRRCGATGAQPCEARDGDASDEHSGRRSFFALSQTASGNFEAGLRDENDGDRGSAREEGDGIEIEQRTREEERRRGARRRRPTRQGSPFDSLTPR